jgi:hypothetical protein
VEVATPGVVASLPRNVVVENLGLAIEDSEQDADVEFEQDVL